MRSTQEQFRLLVQSVTDHAIYMLDSDGRVSSWNAGAQRIKGYTRDEIIGRHFGVFYRDEDRAQGHPQLALQTAVREGRFESEGWRVRKDGSHFWANVVIDPIRDEQGGVIGFAKVTRDVTDKRAARHALEQARESLFQAQKMDAIGQLTGGVAHDFNNLLMVIISSLEMIRRRVGEDRKLDGLIDNAMRGARRGAALTQRLLAFARRQELRPAAVDVPELMNGMSDLLRRSLGPTISLQLPGAQPLKAVLVDANQLELALLNLAVNARDAMPKGGVITIDAAEVLVASAQARLRPGSYVRITVSDEGEGMDEATLARATEPFFTTKGVGKGTGLGLSMVEGLASQSGGHFALTSRRGEGTRAELWLPVAPIEANAVSATPAGEPAPLQPMKVLVVDDDALVLANTAALLEELGHTALAAASAHDALHVLRTQDDVQLLITDHAMPHMTGAELAEAARDEFDGLAVILASGYAELSSELPQPVVRLRKPFGQDELAVAMAAAVSAAR